MFTIDHLLADSCSNPDIDWDVDKSYDENMANAEGWMHYDIGLHCVYYRISARKIEDGEMNQETGEWITPPKFEIRSAEKRET